MTTTIERPQQARTLAMVHTYAEDPGVKKLARTLAGHSREDIWGMLSSVAISLMEKLIFALITFCFINAIAYVTHQMNTPWLMITNAVIFSLVLPVTLFKHVKHISWLFRGADSSLVENKTRRNAIKRSRRAAKRLGSNVIPVLTEEHVASVERVHQSMTTAASTANSKPDSRDYDRLAALLLADLNRESLLLNLIEDRGIVTMDDIEATVRETESNTITPLQDGWL